MSESSMFQFETFTEINDQTFGAILINKDTLKEVQAALQQTMRISSPTHTDGIRSSIYTDGYKQFPPIVFGENYKIVDGFTRLTACVELVEKSMVPSFLIPFMTSNLETEAFNTAPRGSTGKDITWIFKNLNVISGKSRRAAQEAIEASEILDVKMLGHGPAFSPDRTQEHVSKIVRNSLKFQEAFIATCEILKEKGIKPDSCKFSHMLAIFVRYKVNPITIKIVSNNILFSSGTTQKSRFETFTKCENEIMSIDNI